MSRYQFSVRQLLLWTTIVALMLGGIVALDLPAILTPAVLLSYFAYISAWLAFRGPSVASGLRELAARRRRLVEHRRSLQAEVDAKRKAHRSLGGDHRA